MEYVLPVILSDELMGKISKSRSSSSDLYLIPELLMLTNAVSMQV